MKADILIVDDQPENLRLLSSILTEKGYRIRNAVSGKRMFTAITQKVPDLILLDIKLPDLDGYTLCENLKQKSQTQSIPVIFISALNDVFDKVKAFDVGGVDYITKPFQVEEVLRRVGTQIKLKQKTEELSRKTQKLQIQNKQLNQEIQQREQAEEALDIVMHAISHDLISPAIGISLSLKKFLADENKQEFIVDASVLETMYDACQHQLHLINTLQTFKAYNGQFVQLELYWTSLTSLMERILQQWDRRFTQQKIVINYELDPDLPQVKIDPNQIIRVFNNLIVNAIKHNDSEVTLTITIKKEQEVIRCWVADNGRGIPAHECETLFDCYKRGSESQKPGLGLGLYTCREIIKAHGGQIGVESPDGQGTQFWFTIPFESIPIAKL